jgi:hypothetical protein
MLRRHTACQWSGQAARLIYNKCRGRVTRRPYVRLRPLAYVMRSRPRGSIGSPPGWGAEVYATGPHQTRSGHVSAPDPAWVLFKARVCSVLGPRGPIEGGPDPLWGGPDPIPVVRLAHVAVPDQPWRSGLHI